MRTSTSTRLITVLAAATLTSGVACSSTTTSEPLRSDTSTSQSTTEQASAEQNYLDLEARDAARLGVSAVDLATGSTDSHRGDERFAFCSTFKVYAVGAVLAAADAGELQLTDTRTITEKDKVPESAVDWAPGSVVTIADLAAAALTKSDNTSGNLLIREAGGTDALTEFARSLGDTEFRLDRTEPDLNTAIPGDPRDTTTPNSMAAGYRTLLHGDVLTPPSRDQLLAWMADTQTSDARFRAGIPEQWTSADKTGTGSYGVSNDAGLLLGPDGQKILLVVLSTTASGVENSPAMNALVADTTRAVVDELQ
ncbi:class A beta-lactamase [Rhodococcus sp. 06-462-5]|uniref:class A beta-lactamase n=1 Tax=unclassified Rhodococcus (in: high G+C Gram-positive bacteria) TaxID=192944 RepID=UPI000B9B6143|nr:MULTISPECIES: class A beta-lactamase [unclassified Rhodococcus (in: high G+C Gram-positive bacteria)]OZC68340.1 class A beta-lactamase [Rhodococcus sp. 06-462-5]OZE66180.1 class A beta-lactamase [Rhodococcus sp. 02-925g]